MFKLCQEIVWLGTSGKHNTYCMRAAGHSGKHNPDGDFEPAEPVAKVVSEENEPNEAESPS